MDSSAIRKIIHIDMDAFYASVEQRDNPALRNKPIVVGGSPEGRGVVAAASYEARKFGIRSAMSAAKAKRLCRHLIFVRPDFSKYKQVSSQFRKILKEATDVIEPLSLDEAYLDVTENKLGEVSATKIAQYLRARIRGQLKLTASAGVAPNKFLAKVASDWKKPNGLFVIAPHQVQPFLNTLPVRKLWGVGPQTQKRLEALGLKTVSDIHEISPEVLYRKLGKFAGVLISLANGKDPRRVSSSRKSKSMSVERTFSKDISEWTQIEDQLGQLAKELANRIQQRNLATGKTLTLKVRYPDFKTITRSTSLETASPTEEIIQQTAIDLLSQRTSVQDCSVRLLGISIQLQDPDNTKQLLLF